jgi:hypothetical protein
MSQRKTTDRLPAGSRSALREILIFCVLAYLLSWGWWGFKFAPFLGAFFSSGQPIGRSQLGEMDVPIGMFGPMFAAILMRLWISKEAFRPSLRLPPSRKAYVVAIAVPAALAVITLAVNQVTGLGNFIWAGDSIPSLLGTILLLLPLSTIAAIGEEYGWRGYLLPRLLPGGEFKATIIMGFLWAMWHLPILVVGLTFPGESLAVAIPVFVFAIVMTSFLFTGLHQISGGCFWTAALLHGTLNTLTMLTSTKHYPDGSQLVVGFLGLNYAVILLVCVCAHYLIRRRSPGS